MSFIQVQCIYVAVPVLMTLMSGAGTFVSKRFGRVQTMVLLKLFGVGLLVSMTFIKARRRPPRPQPTSCPPTPPPPPSPPAPKDLPT
jgi:hypothetical protein